MAVLHQAQLYWMKECWEAQTLPDSSCEVKSIYTIRAQLC